jgi:hypothetical protein
MKPPFTLSEGVEARKGLIEGFPNKPPASLSRVPPSPTTSEVVHPRLVAGEVQLVVSDLSHCCLCV